MLARLETWLKFLPPPLKSLAKRMAPAVDVVLRRRFRRQSGYTGPIPPARLRARTGSGIRVDVFFGTGLGFVRSVEAALAGQGRNLRECRVVYDWGCGCGRLFPHLDARRGPQTRLMGSDVDPEAIGWAQRAWPDATLRVNGFRPPLPAGAGEVDCLISSSIFTHLTEADQDLWLAELRRVLAPDGVALVTVAGPDLYAAMRERRIPTRSRELMDRLSRMPDLAERGFVFEPYTRRAGEKRDFSGIDDTYGLAFHAPEYIEQHWSRWLTLLDRRPAEVNVAQDLLVLAPAGRS